MPSATIAAERLLGLGGAAELRAGEVDAACDAQLLALRRRQRGAVAGRARRRGASRRCRASSPRGSRWPSPMRSSSRRRRAGRPASSPTWRSPRPPCPSSGPGCRGSSASGVLSRLSSRAIADACATTRPVLMSVMASRLSAHRRLAVARRHASTSSRSAGTAPRQVRALERQDLEQRLRPPSRC